MSGMQLKCRIREVEYEANLVQGATFSDEYNETLDSGTIIISNVNKIKDLKPYDDVYIYTGEYTGYTPPVYKMNEEKKDVECYVESKNSLTIFRNKTIRIHKSILNGRDPIICLHFLYNDGKSYRTVYEVQDNKNNTISLNYAWGKKTFLNKVFTLSGDFYVFSATYTALSFEFWLSDIEAYYYEDVELISQEQNTNQSKTFYKHLLVNQFNEEYINLTGDSQKTNGIYKYKIELFSETKKLETIQLPNISVTQPLQMYGKDKNGNVIKLKKTVWQYLYNFVNMYSPKIRIVDNVNKKTWKYVNKYSIDYSLKEIFDNVYCPDFSLNSPNLRDVLSKLMVVKDYIPYVQDDVIKGLDITKRRGTFNVDLGSINYVSGTMSSGDYASNLRRGYSSALSQDNSAKIIEYLGFRNSDSALMTIENMRLETRFPIYKINKIYLCYYKKGKVVNFKPISTADEDVVIEGNAVYNSDNEKLGDVTGESVFLCKQDITKLVKLDSERNLLSQDWETLKNATTVDELAKYKIATVGYSIGSNYITGWGERFSYPKDNTYWFKRDKTYLQKLAEFMDSKYPYGIYNNAYFTEALGDENYFLLPKNSSLLDNIETVFDTQSWFGNILDFLGNPDGLAGAALKLKSFFFEVDYQAFYNGTVIHSKDGAEDEITINDNSSSSLTLLEQDGLFQKEKINRYGNKNITIPARYKYYYDNENNLVSPIEQLQQLGSVYERDDEEDVIIYHREYQIFENEIKCTYVGSKDYVLKNYFTSVYAKHRTYNLMSYGESVRRSENRKTTLLLSKDKAYYDDDVNRGLEFEKFTDNYICLFFDAFKPDNAPAYKDDFNKDNIINYAYIKFKDKKYLSDLNAFVSGNSMCFNLTMFDNVSMGVFISEAQPEYRFEIENDYVGSVQNWAMTVDNSETGAAKTMGFYISHINKKDYFNDKPQKKENFDTSDVYDKLLSMPIIINDVEETNVVHVDDLVLKDNKEVLDMTFQVEPISDDSDIIFSNWLMKLSSLISTKNKIGQNWEIKDYDNPVVVLNLQVGFAGCPYTSLMGVSIDSNIGPFIFFKITQSELDLLEAGYFCNTTLLQFECRLPDFGFGSGYYAPIRFLIRGIKSVSSNEIVFNADVQQRIVWKKAWWEDSEPWSGVKDAIFRKIYTDSDGVYYFSFSFVDNFKIGYFSDIINPDYIDRKYLIYPEEMLVDTTNITKSPVDYSFMEAMNTQDYSLGVYPSDATFVTKTYYKNMWLVLDKKKMEKTIVYDELTNDDFGTISGSTRWKINDSVDSHFKFEKNGIIPKIRIHLDSSWKDKQYKSIQFWFLDRQDDSIDSTYNGSYKFVFGVNISDADYSRGFIDIYISELSNKDKSVYDENRIKIGSIYNFGENIWALADKANVYYDNSYAGIVPNENEIVSHMTYESNNNFKISTISYCDVSFYCRYRITTSSNQVIYSDLALLSYGTLTETVFNSPNDINISKVEILNTQSVVLKTYNNSVQGSDFTIYGVTNSGLYIQSNSDDPVDLYVDVKDFKGNRINSPKPIYVVNEEFSEFIPIENSDANYADVYVYDFFNNLIKQEAISSDTVILPIVKIVNVSSGNNVTYVIEISNKNPFPVTMTRKISGALSTTTVGVGETTNVNITFYSDGYINVYFQFNDSDNNYSQVWYGLLSKNNGFISMSVSNISRLEGVSEDDIICYTNFADSKILVYNNSTSDITVSKIQILRNGTELRNYSNLSMPRDRILDINSNNDNLSSYNNLTLNFYLENGSVLSFTKTCTTSDTNMLTQYDKTRGIALSVTGTYSNSNFNLSVVNTSSLYNANIERIEVGIVNGGGVSDGTQRNIFIQSQGGEYTHSFTASPASASPIFSVKIYDYWGNLISNKTFNVS